MEASTKVIRRWLKENGYPVHDKGPISHSFKEIFYQNNPQMKATEENEPMEQESVFMQHLFKIRTEKQLQTADKIKIELAMNVFDSFGFTDNQIRKYFLYKGKGLLLDKTQIEKTLTFKDYQTFISDAENQVISPTTLPELTNRDIISFKLQQKKYPPEVMQQLVDIYTSVPQDLEKLKEKKTPDYQLLNVPDLDPELRAYLEKSKKTQKLIDAIMRSPHIGPELKEFYIENIDYLNEKTLDSLETVTKPFKYPLLSSYTDYHIEFFWPNPFEPSNEIRFIILRFYG